MEPITDREAQMSLDLPLSSKVHNDLGAVSTNQNSDTSVSLISEQSLLVKKASNG